MNTFFGITWAALYNWKFIGIALIASIILIIQLKKRTNAIKILGGNTTERLLPNYSSGKHYLKTALQIIGILFLFLVLLKPQWGKKEEIVFQEGRDLLIAIDVSRSMLAQDCKPNRLAFAKEMIKSLVNQLPTERVGLILFSGTAVVQCPLTNDYAAFFMFLDQLDAETISSGTTAIDQALLKAIEIFETTQTRKNKLLVLFTDGEDFSSNLAHIKTRAAALGMHIFTLGVGTTQGAPIPLVNDKGQQEGHQKDAKGDVVISRLNEGILKTLAADSGGIFLSTCNEGDSIEKLVKQIKQFEREKLEDKEIELLHDRYYYFAAVSFICFLVDWLL